MNASKSLVEVGISMVLRDRFTKEAGKISNSFNQMMNGMNNWNRGIQMSYGNVAETGAQILSAMSRAYKYSADVHNEIWMASKIAGATAQEQSRLMQVAKEVNEQTPLTAMQVASASRYLAMAGNKADAIEKMIPPISKLASILGVDPGGKGGVADMVTNIMSMFQLPMSNAAKVTDVLYTAVTNANISLEDLAATIRYSGADMNAAGIELRELAAAAGVLGDMGIQGSMAGTSLGNMIRNLQLALSGQKKNGLDTLKALGLNTKEFYDAKGNLIDLYDIYRKFLPIYQQLDSKSRTQAFYNIFGVRGMRGIIPILEAMAAGSDKMGTILGRYEGNKGIVDKVNTERLQTMAGIIDQMESSLENTVVTLGEALAPIIGPIAQGITWVSDQIEAMSSTGIGKFLIGVTATGVAVTTLVAGFRTAASMIKMVASFQTLATNASAAQTGAVTRTNSNYLVMSAYLDHIANQLRYILQLQMMANAYSLDARGRWHGRNGRYVRTPRVEPVPPFIQGLGTTSGGGAGGAAVRGTGMGGALGMGAGRAALSRWGSKGLARVMLGLTGVGGRLLGLLGGPIGLAFTIGIPLLTTAISSLTSSTDENTRALSKEEIRENNRNRFIEDIKTAIREGFKDTSIGVTVDGQQVGSVVPGTNSVLPGFNYGL